MEKANKIKKFILFLLLFSLTFTFVACRDDETDDPTYTIDDLKTKYTNELKLETNYQNMTFLSKGIEKVKLLRAVDGDTAHFLDGKNNTIKIRFLGINTPESTGRIAPWGKKASYFTKSKLENATEIVIESNNVGTTPELDTTGGRYLGYVWYKTKDSDDFRLLNLEIIEQCFSYFTGNAEKLKYGNVMLAAYQEVKVTKLRVFGEKDPDYDYRNTVQDITIAELRNNYSSYSTGSKLKIQARVVRKVGNSLFIEDVEDTYNEDTGETSRAGIFLYHSFVAGLSKYKPGEIISFECQASDDDTYGMQLVNASNIRKIQDASDYVIREIPDSVRSLEEYEGFVVKVSEFTVTKISKESDTDAFTIYGTMKNGAELMVRIDGDASPKLSYDYAKVGRTYSVIGGVSRYVNPFEKVTYFQIKLGNLTEETIGDFKEISK